MSADKQDSTNNNKPAASKPEPKPMDLGHAPTKVTQYSLDPSKICYPEKGRADSYVKR